MRRTHPWGRGPPGYALSRFIVGQLHGLTGICANAFGVCNHTSAQISALLPALSHVVVGSL